MTREQLTDLAWQVHHVPGRDGGVVGAVTGATLKLILLALIRHAGEPVSIRVLAEECCTSTPTICRALRVLEARNLIARHRPPGCGSGGPANKYNVMIGRLEAEARYTAKETP